MLVYDESRHPQNHTLRGRDVYCEDCDVGAWDYRFGSFVLVVTTKPTFTHYGLYAGQFDFPVQVRPVWNDSRRISGKKIKCDHANCEDASWKWTDLTEKVSSKASHILTFVDAHYQGRTNGNNLLLRYVHGVSPVSGRADRKTARLIILLSENKS